MISLTKSQNQSGARKPLMTGRIGSMYDMTCVGHRVSDGAFPQVAIYIIGKNDND